MKKNMRSIRLDRAPFIRTDDGEVFADVLFHHRHPLPVDFARLAANLASADPRDYLIGRRLTPAELRLFDERRSDSDDEIHAWIIRNENARWPRPRRR